VLTEQLPGRMLPGRCELVQSARTPSGFVGVDVFASRCQPIVGLQSRECLLYSAAGQASFFRDCVPVVFVVWSTVEHCQNGEQRESHSFDRHSQHYTLMILAPHRATLPRHAPIER
jgi:hypothetical protein